MTITRDRFAVETMGLQVRATGKHLPQKTDNFSAILLRFLLDAILGHNRYSILMKLRLHRTIVTAEEQNLLVSVGPIFLKLVH